MAAGLWPLSSAPARSPARYRNRLGATRGPQTELRAWDTPGNKRICILAGSDPFGLTQGITAHKCQARGMRQDGICLRPTGLVCAEPDAEAGLVGDHPTPADLVSAGGGALCYNCRLGYASGLTLNMTELDAKYTVITIPPERKFAPIPLTTLLRDSRCRTATEIHWCAADRLPRI
jgi:hypothetical protein